MRIAIFTNCYKPLVNGVVGAVSLLRQGFLEQGHEVYLFTPAFDDFKDDEPNIYRYPAVDLTTKVKYPVAIPFSREIAKVLAELKLDLIHSHHPFVLGPLGLKIARRKGIPIVYTFHTQYDQYSHYVPLPSSLVSWYSKQQVSSFCRKVDRITTPAESARQVLLKYGVANPITVIPNPTDLTKFQNGNGRIIREKYGLTTEKLLINVGRVAPEKNLGMLLESFKLLLGQAPAEPIKLMIVGDGPELNNLIRQSEDLGIKEKVIFTGMVDPAQIPNYLAAAQLFVMTSTSEVKPLAQLEALAAGLPIVSVSAAGANDTIIPGENGLLVPLEVKAVAEAVLELTLDEKRLGAMGEAARNTAKSYAYPNIAREYLNLFQETISTR